MQQEFLFNVIISLVVTLDVNYKFKLVTTNEKKDNSKFRAGIEKFGTCNLICEILLWAEKYV